MSTDANTNRKRFLSLKEVAEYVEMPVRIVRDWIKNGDLVAYDLCGFPNSKKPRYRILVTELEAFLARRATTPPRPAEPKRRRMKDAIPNYYPEYANT